MRTIITSIFILTLGIPAWAEEVAVTPTAPLVEEGGPTAADLAEAPANTELAMLYHVPADATADITPAPSGLPVKVAAGTGADTRLGVDLAAADKASEGWPWYAKAGIIVGCVAVAGVATWAIVEASNDGSHDHDSSEHVTIAVSGEGNSVDVRYGSSETSGPPGDGR